MFILTSANDILIDFNGDPAYLTNDTLYVHDTTDTTEVGASLVTNNSDLGEPTLDKLCNLFDLDYTGEVHVYVLLDGVTITDFTTTYSASRRTQYFYMPLAARRPFQKISFIINTATIGSILYGIEIDFSVLKRRKK